MNAEAQRRKDAEKTACVLRVLGQAVSQGAIEYEYEYEETPEQQLDCRDHLNRPGLHRTRTQ